MGRFGKGVFLAVLLVAACAGQPRKELTLLSYNVGVFSKYEESGIGGVAAVIRDSGADLVALNELDSCNRRHGNYQLKDLADNLGGWVFQFAPAFPFAGGAYGNGVMTRPSPASGKSASLSGLSARSPQPASVTGCSVGLPQAGGSEPRSAAVLETADCVMIAVHLDYLTQAAALKQMRTLTEWVSAEYRGSHKPVFLCGDLNSTPDSEVLAYALKHWTLLSGTVFTYSTEKPSKCIDYILSFKGAPQVEVLSAEVLTAGTASLSDHFPLKVRVRL